MGDAKVESALVVCDERKQDIVRVRQGWVKELDFLVMNLEMAVEGNFTGRSHCIICMLLYRSVVLHYLTMDFAMQNVDWKVTEP